MVKATNLVVGPFADELVRIRERRLPNGPCFDEIEGQGEGKPGDLLWLEAAPAESWAQLGQAIGSQEPSSRPAILQALMSPFFFSVSATQSTSVDPITRSLR